MAEGTFIVLEGIDGSGTTTQVRRLVGALKTRGILAHQTREPSDGPVGLMLRQVLTGRLVVPSPEGPKQPSWASLALLFSADRIDHCEAEIIPSLQAGVTVVSDRYYHSTIAYQSLASDDPTGAAEWIRTLNARARRPDLTIVLDVPGDVAAERRAARAGQAEIFDDLAFQSKLAAFYRSFPQRLAGERITMIDGTGSEDDVHRAVVSAVGAVEATRGRA